MSYQPTQNELFEAVADLRDGEEPQKYLQILDGLEALIYVSDMHTGEILYANKYTREFCGDVEGEICWKVLQRDQDGPCSFCTNPMLVDEDGAPTGSYHWEFQNTSNARWYDIHDRAISWVDGRLVRLEIAYDITDKKLALLRRARALDVLRQCNVSLIRSQREDDLLQDICRILVETGAYRMAWVGYAQDDAPQSVQPVAQFGDDDGYIQTLAVTWSEEPSGQGPTGSAIRMGAPVTLNISPGEPRFSPWHEEAGKRAFKSSIALPLQVGNRTIGALSIYASESDAFDLEEMELLSELAANVAYGIGAIRNRLAHVQIQGDLQMAHEQLGLIMESLPLMPFTQETTGDYAITYMSKGVTEITGYTPLQFMDDPYFWLSHVHPEDRTRVMGVPQPRKDRETQRIEYRFQVSDGSYRWFSCISRMVEDHLVGAWQDIHDEKMLRFEAKQRMQQVIQADKLASLGEVVAGVAHEINNPNSFITYNIPLLQESWEVFLPIVQAHIKNHPGEKYAHITLEEMVGEVSEIIEAITIGSNRINSIVAKLKDFARMDESSPTKLVDINAVIADTLTIVGAQVRKLVGRVDVELGSDLPLFHGHFQKLEQVMANVIMNSANAIQEKERGTILIRTRFCSRLCCVLVEIEDNGQGMAQSVIGKIFDPFFTTKRDSGGTGLGLSVSYGLIQEHGGSIAVLSRPGLGSKFTVFLPVDGRESSLDLQPTILCIDNDPSVLALLKSFFYEAENLPVEVAGSAEGAMSFLEEHPEVDIVISDVRMPGIDGWQLLKNIKEKFPLLPVILISGIPSSEQDLDGREYVPDYFMDKPIQLLKLAEAVNKVGRQRL